MNRRQFLKAAAASLATIQLPGLALANTQSKNPLITGEIGYYEGIRFYDNSILNQFKNRKEIGRKLPISCCDGYKKTISFALRYILKDLRFNLLPGTMYELHGLIPSYYGRECGLAWYANHNIQYSPLVPLQLNCLDATAITDKGYFLFGRGRV